MKILMKRLAALFLFIVYISCLLAGCTININVGNPSEDTANKTDGKTDFDYIFNNESTMYESRASIYISNTIATEVPAISSSDLAASASLAETYSVFLNSSKIQNKIKEEYPGVEYTLTLEPINETEICALIATGENPEYLDEICNMAVSLLCEQLPKIIQGSSCKVVNYAKPAQLVGTN